MKVIRGSLPAGASLNEVFQVLGFSLPKLSDFVALNVLENIVVEEFANSNPANTSKTKSKRPSIGLGPLAEGLVMYLTGQELPENIGLGFDLVTQIPVLAIYGQIEEMFIKLSKKARDIDSQSLDWPLLFKTMTIP